VTFKIELVTYVRKTLSSKMTKKKK